MSFEPAEIADAFEGGRRAALDGEGINRNPFSAAQGSPQRILSFQWRKGFHVGEAEQQDAAGHFKDAS